MSDQSNPVGAISRGSDTFQWQSGMTREDWVEAGANAIRKTLERGEVDMGSAQALREYIVLTPYDDLRELMESQCLTWRGVSRQDIAPEDWKVFGACVPAPGKGALPYPTSRSGVSLRK